MIKFKNLGNVDTRSGFGEGLLELGKENKNIVALCADLTGSLKMNAFKENFLSSVCGHHWVSVQSSLWPVVRNRFTVL